MTKFYVGDHGQTLYRQLMNGDAPHDLTGATVTWNFYPPSKAAVEKDADLGSGDHPADEGWCKYTIEDGLFTSSRVGQWFCTIQAELADGSAWHGQFRFLVLAQDERNVP